MEFIFKNKKKFILLLIIAIGLFTATTLVDQIWVTNQEGFIQVKQAFYTGKMTVRSGPGTYGKWFGNINTYDMSDEIFLSGDRLDGGDGAETQAVKVAFPNGTADVDIVVMYELPMDNDLMKSLNRKYNNNKAVKAMVRQQVLESVGNTATLMSAERAYITKSEFRALAREQLSVGLYEPLITIRKKEVGGQVQEIKQYAVKRDSSGRPIVRSKAMLPDFGIKITQFNLKGMVFDSKTKALIDSRKEAEKAAQDAITAKAKGEAKIAIKKAEQEALKIEAVTQKEKERDVAELEAQKNKKVAELKAEEQYNVSVFQTKQAKEKAKKIEAEGRAKAVANRLLVSSGLTPQQSAKLKLDIADVVSKNLSEGIKGATFPNIMTFGGGEGMPTGPIEALGFKAMFELTKEFNTE